MAEITPRKGTLEIPLKLGKGCQAHYITPRKGTLEIMPPVLYAQTAYRHHTPQGDVGSHFSVKSFC